MQGTELVIHYFVFHSENFHISTNSSYIENKECFGVWPKHGYFNFFEGGLLCAGN